MLEIKKQRNIKQAFKSHITALNTGTAMPEYCRPEKIGQKTVIFSMSYPSSQTFRSKSGFQNYLRVLDKRGYLMIIEG